MDTQSKIIFTIALAAIAIGVLFVDARADNAGPDWLWRFGKNDPVRNLVCRSDGTLRPYTKAGLLVGFAVVVACLWLLPAVL